MSVEGPGLRALCILAIPFLAAAAPRTVVCAEIELPLQLRSIDRLVASIPVGLDSPVELDLQLGFDEGGKLVCSGTCTVDGVPVETKGAVKADRYSLVLRHRGTGLLVKAGGEIGSGVLDMTYKGPKALARNRISVRGSQVEVATGTVVPRIEIDAEVDPKGKLTGSGRILAALGVGGEDAAALTGKLSGDRLSIKLKSGRRQVSFSGVRESGGGEARFVGTLKARIPPYKHTVPAFAVSNEALFPRTNRAPSAAIASPLDGEEFEEGATVRCAGTGLDPEDGALSGPALVWRSDRDGILGSGLVVDRSDLSAGAHTITLTATDAGGASASDAVSITILPRGNSPPEASIVAPADASRIKAGVEVVFSANVQDPEDGALPAASIVWSSDRDGEIGRGAIISTVSLSIGIHTITLSARDSGGLTATASVTITIEAVDNAAPQASIESPADGSRFTFGDEVVLAGSASDLEDGPLPDASLLWSSDRDGELGRGAVVRTSALSVGSHVLSLSARDSAGAVGRASVAVVIDPAELKAFTGGPFGGALTTLAVHPRDSRVVYAGSTGSATGVFKTSDGGLHWIWTGLRGTYIHDVAVDGNDAVWAAASTGLYRSTDDGRNWDEILLHDNSVFPISILPSGSSTVVVLTSVGLFKSTERGELVRLENNGLPRDPQIYLSAMALAPSDPRVIYLGTSRSELYRSVDGGDTWRLHRETVDGSWVDAVAVSPSDPNDILIVTNVELYWSDSGGESLTPTGNSGVRDIAFHPQESAIVYACRNNVGVIRSEDGGRRWTPLAGSPRSPYTISMSPSDSTSLYVGDLSRGFFLSVDGGAGWEQRIEGFHAARPFFITTHPSQSGVLYTSAMELGLLRSTDNGAAWKRIWPESEDGGTVTDLVIDTRRPDVIWASGSVSGVRGILLSTNGGDSWTAMPGPAATANVYALAVDPSDSAVYAATEESAPGTSHWRLYRGSPEGEKWEELADRADLFWADKITVDPSGTGILYVAGYSGIHRWDDHERSWTPLVEKKEVFHAVAVDPERPSTLFATWDAQLWRSDDSGRSWNDITDPRVLTRRSLAGFVVDAVDSRKLWTLSTLGTTDGELSMSPDGGESWTAAFSLSALTSYAVGFTVDPTRGRYAYIMTPGGVWTAELPR